MRLIPAGADPFRGGFGRTIETGSIEFRGPVVGMATYIYDEEADALQVLLVDENDVAIARTVELSPNVHVDLDPAGKPISAEFLYARSGPIDTDIVEEHFGIRIVIPFSFAA